ncbi:L,D-transpeptidase [Cutibacterium avidum]|uniref:L,D-transpeptidase n=1 Tax=Cutibacterium avidum TaxID=33010 RepID=UPI003080298B
MVPPVSRAPRSRPGGGPTVVLLPALYSDSQVAASRLDLMIASGSTPTPEPRAGSGLWRGGGFLAALVAMVCLVAGCGSSMPAATTCIDSVPGAGDLRARHRYPVTCPTASPEPTVKASSRQEAPDGPTDKDGADDPEDSVSPQPDEPGPSIPGPTPPPGSLAVGDKSSAGAGTYVLWIKAENHVYLVDDDVVKRSMLTTAEPWKTPVGDYEIEYKARHAASTEDGIRWYIPNFLAFYHRPGATGRIGFHQIPWDEKTNKPAQPVYTLGLPGYLSHGCARLAPKDSEALYNFAHEGTKVKVR